MPKQAGVNVTSNTAASSALAHRLPRQPPPLASGFPDCDQGDVAKVCALALNGTLVKCWPCIVDLNRGRIDVSSLPSGFHATESRSSASAWPRHGRARLYAKRGSPPCRAVPDRGILYTVFIFCWPMGESNGLIGSQWGRLRRAGCPFANRADHWERKPGGKTHVWLGLEGPFKGSNPNSSGGQPETSAPPSLRQERGGRMCITVQHSTIASSTTTCQ